MGSKVNYMYARYPPCFQLRIISTKQDVPKNISFVYYVALLVLILGNDVHVNPGPNINLETFQ